MLDARPFLQLKVGDSVFRCARPQVKPLSLGVTNGSNGVLADQATHTIEVYVGLTPASNAPLMDNALVKVNEQGKDVWTAYRVLRNGVERNPGIWKLWVRANDAMTAPVEPVSPETDPTTDPAPAPLPSDDDWYMP